MLDMAEVDWSADRYGLYRQFRAADPFHRGKPMPDGHDIWWLFARRDVAEALQDPRFGRVGPGDAAGVDRPVRRSPGLVELDRDWAIHCDPPIHKAKRAALRGALAPALVTPERHLPLIDRLVARLGSGRTVDVMDEVADPLAVGVLLGAIGVEPDDIDALAKVCCRMLRRANDAAEFAAGRARLADALRALAARRRADPSDDAISRLVAASPDRLLAPVSEAIFIVTTGFGGLADGLANALTILSDLPDVWRSLASGEADAERVARECLRLEAPLQMIDRWVQQDADWHGRRLRAGDRLYLVLGSANRDQSAGECFDLASPRPQELSFGGGIHACLAAGFAPRLIGLALRRLVARLPDLALAGVPSWIDDGSLRHLKGLQIRA